MVWQGVVSMETKVSSGSTHFSLQQLAEGIYAAIAEDGGAAVGNSGIIDLGGQIIVFDTFLTPQAASDLRQLVINLFGRAPHLVVNSHYHNDHIWGNQVFAAEAQIIASNRTCELIATAGIEEFKSSSDNSAQRFASFQSQYQTIKDEQQRSEISLWLGYYGGLVEALPQLKVCPPGITFQSQLEFHGSHRSARLFTFADAHTGSDAVLYLPQEGIAFVSDLLFVGYHPYLADGDPLKLRESVKKVGELGAAWYVPGHGPVGTRVDLVIMVEYIDFCLESAHNLISMGRDLEDEIARLEPTEKFRHWRFARFFPSNIRLLCQRLNPAVGV
jgi:cyclase